MSDCRYRQSGYQDDDRDRQPRQRGPAPDGRPRERTPDAPRTPNLMASHQVVRCRNCATLVDLPIGTLSTCSKCQAPLHSCVQCAQFDPGARFQCMETLAAPVSPKDASNDCSLFAPTVRVERQTSTARGSSSDADDPRKAFDDLFKL